MVKVRKRGEEIRGHILKNVEDHSANIVPMTMDTFGISRQAVYSHIRQLISQGSLIRDGYGAYRLRPQEEWDETFDIADNPQEDVVWRNRVRPKIGEIPDNALSIWNYGFTEMFNNVVDHSGSSTVWVQIKKTAYITEMVIWDRGVGIFNKIKNTLGLLDERHAVLELTKGKLTTDPASHSGEGIFFSSRMFDTFGILSGEVYLSHTYDSEEDWVLQTSQYCQGTWIVMKLMNNTSRIPKEIFDKFTSGDDLGFTKTVLPVRLAKYGDEKLISRSQAKRLLERIDRFKTVLFDFNEVDTIGQAFTDEVFRVFVSQHPQIRIIPINTNKAVSEMITRVTSAS